MITAMKSRILWTTLLLVILFFTRLSAYAQYSGGTGEPNDPYQIATSQDLMLLGETPEDYDKNFILTSNIDLDPNLSGHNIFDKAVIAPDVKSNDYPSEFQGAPFTGVFDGNGYTISNLTIVGTGYLGLFGRLDSRAEVRNVGVVNVNIIGSADAVGGLVGYNYDGIIAQCYSTGAISGTSYVGGLVGDNGSVYTIFTPGARVTDSYSNVTVDGSACVGGLVGGNWLSISTSYSTGNIRASHGSIGGLVGYNRSYGDITYCYASCNISVGHDSHRVGGLVGHSYGEITQCYASGSIVSTADSTKVGGLVGNNAQNDYYISSCFWDVESSGLSESDGGTGLTTAQMQDPNILADAGWDFVHESDCPSDIWAEPQGGGYPILSWQLPESQLPALPSFSGGTGNATDPYLISTPQQLNSIGHNSRLMNAHFKLMDDIDLADVKFFTIGNAVLPFNGTFDGNGYAVSNFSYTSTNRNHAGLFGYIDSPSAEVRNLGLIDPNVDSTTEWKVGSLVGQLERGTMTGCYVSGGSVSGRGYIRGLENTGSSIVGGLVGVSYGTITDCHAGCGVFGPKYVGGLLGAGEGIITDCNFSGEATGDDCVGGLVGLGRGIITKCTSSGDVSGNSRIG
ncbi:MAG: GLUG motif-containing protein, partial [Planctomycetota bacterium]